MLGKELVSRPSWPICTLTMNMNMVTTPGLNRTSLLARRP